VATLNLAVVGQGQHVYGSHIHPAQSAPGSRPYRSLPVIGDGIGALFCSHTITSCWLWQSQLVALLYIGHATHLVRFRLRGVTWPIGRHLRMVSVLSSDRNTETKPGRKIGDDVSVTTSRSNARTPAP